MRKLTTSAAALGAALLLGLAGASPSFAKGHNNGFGLGAAGPATAGKVDDGQKNTTGGREGSYGIRDQVPEVRENQMLGIHGNSDNAQMRGEGSGHPSERSGNE
jgi:hypothetical protein